MSFSVVTHKLNSNVPTLIFHFFTTVKHHKSGYLKQSLDPLSAPEVVLGEAEQRRSLGSRVENQHRPLAARRSNFLAGLAVSLPCLRVLLMPVLYGYNKILQVTATTLTALQCFMGTNLANA